MRHWLALVLALAMNLEAQSNTASGEMHGTVYDPSGAVIPGTVVTLRRDSIGFSMRTFSGGDGEFRFLIVPPGEYELEFSKAGFQAAVVKNVRVTIGQVVILDAHLQLGVIEHAIVITGEQGLVETGRTQQANTIQQEAIANLPIDRRDFLTFALLMPGVVDSTGVADNTDLRVKQTPQTGLSFSGSNGRGNSVTIDGGEANDASGGARSTLPQEAVQEFQINRSNYSAELGGASGGAIDIVSRGGTNQRHASVFDYLRNAALDAGNPFARVLENSRLVRIKPPSKRNQFGASAGGPIRKNRTFFFSAFEGLLRRESSVVSILTDTSIFEPTAEQQKVLNTFPAPVAAGLRGALRAPRSTIDLFARNSGVFPFDTDGWRFSARLDHRLSDKDTLFFRHNFSHLDESNANLQALVGATRGTKLHQFDPTIAAGSTHIFNPGLVNEARLQWAYRGFALSSIDPYGPEIRIAGYGVFNRDYLLPSRNIERRYEFRDNVTWVRGRHTFKFGGQLLVRGARSDSEVFFGGRFTFGDLPGAVLNPNLPASFTVNALQAFNLGLAQTYLQGFGASTVASTEPSVGIFAQDSWQVSGSLRVDAGLRYELDMRKAPVPTTKTNFGPRLSFAWSPTPGRDMVIRGGYGVYYSPIYYQIDWTATALNDFGGKRQIGQAFTSILTPGPAAANNVFTVLRNQGVIGIPTPKRAIRAQDLEQFGISFPRTGPAPPFSVLYGVTPDFANPYSQQVFFSFDRQIGSAFAVSVAYNFARTLRLPRSRDENLLPAPVDAKLGIRVWSDPRYFVDPLIAQRNIFQSTANASYSSLSVEIKKRLSRSFHFDANYTLSKAYDDVTDFNSDFQAFDQMNLRAEHALSAFDQRHKFAAYGTWNAPAGIILSPIFRANSGRPFNLLAGQDLNQDRHDTADRPIGAGRNTGLGPAFWTIDVRLARDFAFGERVHLQTTIDAFNLLNHLNYSSVNNVVGNMAGPFEVKGRGDRTPTQPLGFTSASDPRRLQAGLRIFF